MTTNDVSLRMLRSRSRQAQEYSRNDTQPEPERSGYQPRSQVISLPILVSIYGGRPVTYANGRLMAGDEVVRVRKEIRT
jgi:hypothetical protein